MKKQSVGGEDQRCETCYRIACKQCDWVASEEEVRLIQRGELTLCPLCSWKPGQSTSSK